MKKIVLILGMIIICFQSFSQCIPDSSYSDSISGIYPSSGFDTTSVGVNFHEILYYNIPSTLIEATNGDSSQLLVDTLGQTLYIGDFTVDSMVLNDVINLPSTFSLVCNNPGCVFLGGEVGCGDLYGTPTTSGTYTISPSYNIYFSGVLTINAGGVPLTIPVVMDYYSYFGEYVVLQDYYTIVITEATSIQVSDMFTTNISRVFRKNKAISLELNSSITQNIHLSVSDLLGKEIYKKHINLQKGINSHIINENMREGIYIITIDNHQTRFSKKVYIPNPH